MDEIFYNQIRDLGVLTQEETNDLFVRKSSGDMSARNKLVLHNIGLIFRVIKVGFSETSKEKEELFYKGIIGLIKAVDTYSISKNDKFSNYASVCIKNSILDLFKSKRKEYVTISYNEDGVLELLEQENDSDITYFLNTEEEIINKELYKYINEMLKVLPPLEKEIIELYFGCNENIEYTQKSISKKLNISQSYVSKIINKNLRKLKEFLLEEKLIEMKNLKYTRF